MSSGPQQSGITGGQPQSGMTGPPRPGYFGAPSQPVIGPPMYGAPANQWSFGEAVVNFLRARTFAEVTSFLLLAGGVATPLVYLTWIRPAEVQQQQRHEEQLAIRFVESRRESDERNEKMHRENREAYNSGLLQLQQSQQRMEENHRETMRLLLNRVREDDFAKKQQLQP